MSNLKTCSRCGNQVEAQTKFCPQCGSPEFIFADNPVNQQPYTPNQQAYTPDQQSYVPNQQAYTPNQQAYAPNQRPYMPDQQSYAPTQQGTYTSMPYPPQYDNGANMQPPKKKGLQWWHILLMVVGVAVVVLLVVLIVVSVKGDKKDSANGAIADKAVVAQTDEDKEDQKELSSDPAPEKPAETTTKREASYTKGAVSGNVYTNEWADLQFVIPDGFSDPGEAFYYTGDEATEIGLCVTSDDFVSSVIVICEKLPSGEDYTEDEYLDVVTQQLMTQNVDFGVEQLYDDYSTTIVAERGYTTAFMSWGGVVQGYFVRKLDNYMVVICITAETEEEVGDLVSMFTPVE